MSDEARAESMRQVNARQRGAFDGLDMVSHGTLMAEWQAERDAVRIAELEAEIERLQSNLAAVRAVCVARTEEYPDDPYDFVREFALGMLAVLDGKERADERG